MDRRKFLVSSGLVGAGVLGVGSVAPGAAGRPAGFKFKFASHIGG
jgi:hypothetical protein